MRPDEVARDLPGDDLLPVGPDTPGMRVEILDAKRALVFRSADRDWVWAFVVRPEGDVTRLVSRNRIAATSASIGRRLINRLVMEPGSLIMERKMLLGIKQRAEGHYRPPSLAAAPVARTAPAGPGEPAGGSCLPGPPAPPCQPTGGAAPKGCRPSRGVGVVT